MLAATRAAWLGVRRRPLRTLLTAVSLLIGVCTLVLVEGSSATIEQAMVQRAVLLSGPRTTVAVPLLAPDTTFDAVDWEAQIGRATADLGARVARLDRYGSINLTGADETVVAVDLVAAGSGLTGIRPFEVVDGTWFGADPLVPQLVLNRAARASLAAPAPQLALATRDGLGRLPALAVGVVDDGELSPVAYVATADAAALRRAGLVPVSRSVLVFAPEADQAELAARVTTLAATMGREASVGEITRIDQVDSFGDQLTTARDVFLAIALMALLVGSLGILNIGLATLHERAEEVALRRALGASRARVALMLVLESQLVAVVASVAAIGITTALVPVVLERLSAVPIDAPGLPVSAIAAGIAASMVAALVGSAAPSIKAARAPIASLLR